MLSAIERRIVDDTIALAQIPAPTFDESERIAWLQNRLATLPGRRSVDDAGSLIWSFGRAVPRVLLCAHVDTVFDRTTPHTITEVDGALVGPGCGDNAVAVATAISVVEELGGTSSASFAVAFTVGEEGLGNLKGATEACRSLRPESVIALEGHGVHRLAVDCVGSVRARIRVSGPGGHSWANRGRPSAIDGLFRLCLQLRELRAPESSVNIGTVLGGRSVNAIADHAECVIERRALDEHLLDAFAEQLTQLPVDAGLDVSHELIGRRPAGRLNRDARLLSVVRAVRRDLGMDDDFAAASTDANAALALGVPAVSLGCVDGTDMHTTRERIDLSTLPLGREQLRRSLLALLVE